MLYTEILADGRMHTYSDTFKIRQVETDAIYDDAVDVLHHEYDETDIPLEDVEVTDSEFREIIEGVLK